MPGHQPAAQTAGDGGQDDVVDGAAVQVTDGAVVGQLGVDRHDPALLAVGADERALVGGPAPGHSSDDATGGLRGGVGGAQQRRGTGADGVGGDLAGAQGVAQRTDGQAAGRRSPARGPLVAAQALDLGALVEQHLPQVDGGHAVHERLVGLRQHRDAAVGEALDEVDLPQRLGAVQRTGDDAGDQLAQLLEAAGARQCGAAYVVAEVEVRVVDPDRVGQPAGDLLDLLPVARHERDPVTDQLDQLVVVEARVARVEDLDRGVVHGRRRRLLGQEGEVPGPEPLAHRVPFVIGPGSPSPDPLLLVRFCQTCRASPPASSPWAPP